MCVVLMFMKRMGKAWSNRKGKENHYWHQIFHILKDYNIWIFQQRVCCENSDKTYCKSTSKIFDSPNPCEFNWRKEKL